MTAPVSTSPIDRFIGQRRARWERLVSLLNRATGVRALQSTPFTVDELDEMLQLYRLTTTDLAIARRDYPGDRVTHLLNQIVARAYGYIYRESLSPVSQVRRFYARDLPREYRAAWPFLAAAASMLFVPWIVVMLATILAPDTAALILPSSLLADIRSGQTWFASSPDHRPAMASFIMTNNIQVSVFALAGGILGGLGTIYVLVDNGVELGAVAGALVAYRLGDQLLGFIGPHGFLELSVVVVAGACGLMIGHAVVWPGLRRRGTALSEAASRAVRLLLGLLPLLVVAGLLEGFVSPEGFAWPLKIAIGVVSAVALYAYLLLVGRGPTAGLEL